MRSDPELISGAQPQDYHQHYALNHAPFGVESDTSLFVLSPSHEEALDKLYRGLLARHSVVLITGAPGTGKTLLLQTLKGLAQDQCEFLQLHTQDMRSEANASSIGPPSIAALLARAAGLAKTDCSSAERNSLLRNHLRKARSDGRRLVVIIDDAHELSVAQLNELRSWSNLDDHQGRVLQFILAGHTRIGTQLNRPELANLKQRIGTRFRLQPLNLHNTQRYIVHRCALAGAPQALFEHGVIIRIYSLTRGLPRLINTVADALLLQAFLRGSRTVQVEDLRHVSRDLDLSYAPIIERPFSDEQVSDGPESDLLQSPLDAIDPPLQTGV